MPSGRKKTDAKTPTPTSTFALGAELTPTALANVLELRKQQPQTPYNLTEWQREFSLLNLHARFPKILSGLAYGFTINFPPILRTQCPPNNVSISSFDSDFRTIVCKEITKGRYIGPFPLSLIEQVLGPYQSSPLSIIPKQGRPGKFRVIQNFSFPANPSPPFPNPAINHYISAEDFPTTWGKFSTIYSLITHLPPGSEAATRDVAEAYRTIPLHPSQWPASVVRISDSLGCIDTNLAFGSTPAAGVYGHISDACCEIFRHNGIGPVDKWVDDHIFFRIRTEYLEEYNKLRKEWNRDILKNSPSPHQSGGRIWFQGSQEAAAPTEEFNEDCSAPLIDYSAEPTRTEHDAQFTYCLRDIDALSTRLGIPWEPSKDQPFHHSTIYLGFEWNLDKLSVSLSPAKTAKYLAAIENWLQRSRHTLLDVQSLHGKLLHSCAVIPRGRAYLTSLERMIKICTPAPFLPHRPEKHVASDLNWWKQALSQNLTSRPIHPPPQSYADISAFSDASSTGIGIVIGSHWRAWHLCPNWQTLNGKRDISWAEAVGFELLVYTIATISYPYSAFTIHGDNSGVVEGWPNGRHRHPPANEAFRRIHEFIHSLPRDLDIRTTYVPSKSNPADGPSRGILGPPHLLLPDIPIPNAICHLIENCHLT